MIVLSSLAAYFARKGLSQGLSRKLAIGVLAIAFCALVSLGGAIWLHFHDRGVIERDRLQGNVEQLEDQVEADTAAADQRLQDAAAQRDQEDAYHDAIDNPKPLDPGDPAVRLACERLRRDGQDTTGIPACGGR